KPGHCFMSTDDILTTASNPTITSSPNNNMEKITTTILKTAIEAIPLLSMDNFTLWKKRVENYLDLQELQTPLKTPTGVLSSTDDIQLRTIMTSNLEPAIHANASNQAHIFNSLLHIQFNSTDPTSFSTNFLLQ
ncbi:uncharacterized protein VP01_10503g1, partial [Puccinia sorghi]